MEVDNIKRYIKARLQQDQTTFHGFEKERLTIRNLFLQTAKEGESNSALLIGAKKYGKTTVNQLN
jgi:hypothetical protein